MTADEPVLRPIGWVTSALATRADAPAQGEAGAPEAVLVFRDEVSAGLAGLEPGAEVLLLTWLHRAGRDVLVVRPRRAPQRQETGVFGTRSPDRPNPIGLHRVTITGVDGTRLRVRNLEAIDGTPVIDVKPIRCPAMPDESD